MKKLKTATGTEETPKIGVLMESSAKRESIESALKKAGFEVYGFKEEKEYYKFRKENKLDATILYGRTSAEVGRVIQLEYMYPKDDSLCVIAHEEVLSQLMGPSHKIYTLPEVFSDKELTDKVRQIIEK